MRRCVFGILLSLVPAVSFALTNEISLFLEGGNGSTSYAFADYPAADFDYDFTFNTQRLRYKLFFDDWIEDYEGRRGRNESKEAQDFLRHSSYLAYSYEMSEYTEDTDSSLHKLKDRSGAFSGMYYFENGLGLGGTFETLTESTSDGWYDYNGVAYTVRGDYYLEKDQRLSVELYHEDINYPNSTYNDSISTLQLRYSSLMFDNTFWFDPSLIIYKNDYEDSVISGSSDKIKLNLTLGTLFENDFTVYYTLVFAKGKSEYHGDDSGEIYDYDSKTTEYGLAITPVYWFDASLRFALGLEYFRSKVNSTETFPGYTDVKYDVETKEKAVHFEVNYRF